MQLLLMPDILSTATAQKLTEICGNRSFSVETTDSEGSSLV
jgi:hypothetical protein